MLNSYFDDSKRREVVFMAIFNKCHAVFVGFLAFGKNLW